MTSRDLLQWFGFKGTPRAVKGRRAGETVTENDYGDVVTADVLQCVHCRHSWEYVEGSGRERGWCTRCNGVTCSRFCPCVPFEQRLWNREHGLPELTPTNPTILVPRDVTNG